MKNINKLIPADLYYGIRFLKQRFFHAELNKEIDEKQQTVWFLDAPDYGNLGDQAIAYATKKFLSDTLPNAQIVEIQESNLVASLSVLKNVVKPTDLIVLQGGGNMGNLYPRYEWIRRLVVRNFPDNKIVIFPQSVYFTADKSGQREKEVSGSVYRNHKNLTIFARDSQSKKKMEEFFPGINIQLSPDIVLYLTGLVKHNESKNIGVCIRDDQERSISNEQLENLLNRIKQDKSDDCIDTLTTTAEISEPITETERETYVIEKLQEFSQYRLIITDRLHGMVFSYVVGTPCIAIDNKTGKSKALYNDWIKNSPLIKIGNLENEEVEMPVNVIPDKIEFASLKSAIVDK